MVSFLIAYIFAATMHMFTHAHPNTVIVHHYSTQLAFDILKEQLIGAYSN